MTTPIENVLSRLDKVRQRQHGQWSARCPSHDDKSPSLSIRETPEGAVLLHCFGGCAVDEIVGALGLEMSDLFQPSDRPASSPRRIARVLTAGQALEILGMESMICALVANDASAGRAISHADAQRAMQAAGRIQAIVAEVNHA